LNKPLNATDTVLNSLPPDWGEEIDDQSTHLFQGIGVTTKKAKDDADINSIDVEKPTTSGAAKEGEESYLPSGILNDQEDDNSDIFEDEDFSLDSDDEDDRASTSSGISSVSRASISSSSSSDSTSSSSSDESTSGTEIASAINEILETPIWLAELQKIDFENELELEDFLTICKEILQQELSTKSYNTFPSFIRFHEEYSRSIDTSFVKFLTSFKAKLYHDGLSCVGLAISLHNLFILRFPTHAASIGLVSCEEVVKDPDNYCIYSPSAKKEHCLVAVKIALGSRLGTVLFDPGYHVNKPIIVMEDGLSPHTGWFVQNPSPSNLKEYNYSAVDNDSGLVTWTVRETKPNRVKEYVNLIYVRRSFAKSIEITEKRSHIYNFKSLVIRSRDEVIAGLFGSIDNNMVTIFYPDSETGERKQIKLSLDDIDEPNFRSTISKLAIYIRGMSHRAAIHHLIRMLRSYSRILEDSTFINQLKEVDFLLEED
ncbi:uncharacterized protein LOC128393726, partial [Panonychus citri]|uniref:uncharacterized protein LOC128393726 n=1 Tax=Panonychus citri TaxID=50023 RepID=UPI002307B38E